MVNDVPVAPLFTRDQLCLPLELRFTLYPVAWSAASHETVIQRGVNDAIETDAGLAAPRRAGFRRSPEWAVGHGETGI